MHDILISARHVLAMNAFVNKSTLAFLKVYYIEDIHIIDNRYQSRVDEMVEILYDPNSETKVIRIGYDLLRQGKRLEFVFTRAVIARALIEKASKLSKPDNHLLESMHIMGIWMGSKDKKTFLILMISEANSIA
ncbi:2206_t:CDS:1 [Funneliformis geosporum]|nr:2206_t:CDS:1 [Funneliformis geosporum]